MNILRYIKARKLISEPDQYVLNLAVTELELYHKRLRGLIDDPNCRANRAKAIELFNKNS